MLKSIFDFLNSLTQLFKQLRPTLFEKTEEEKKKASEEGQKFWDDRQI